MRKSWTTSLKRMPNHRMMRRSRKKSYYSTRMSLKSYSLKMS